MLLAVSIQAQNGSDLIIVMGDNGVAAFNPLTYDANTIALYDADLELVSNAWGDQSGNNYDLILQGAPTITSNAINGHQTVTFNGTDEMGYRETTPELTQPLTFYIVFKQPTWTSGDYLFCSNSANAPLLYQDGASANIYLVAGTALSSDPDLALDTYGIMTAVFNGASSELRTNDGTAVTGNGGANGGVGFNLANSSGLGNYCNIEVAYLIIRGAADDTATQDLFITYLKDRFGL
jgi:hypothetical protein